MDALKILVVDDESRMRKLVKDFLTKKNFQVLEAGDGEEAMDIFYKEKDIALLILDVMMPKMDGWEVCREILGMILLGWGVVQVGLSFQSHDPSQRSQGFLTLAGGLVITFAKEILDLITA